jgi:hypothetical protein
MRVVALRSIEVAIHVVQHVRTEMHIIVSIHTITKTYLDARPCLKVSNT